MSDHPTTSKQTLIVSFLAVIGSLLLFMLVIYLAYLPNRPAPVDAHLIEARKQQLAEVDASGQAALRDYRIVNREAGVAVIPIERAMTIIVREFNSQSAAETAITPSEQ
jgi:hypothetical protein